MPAAERAALASVAEKLRADSQPGFPHTSRGQGGKAGLRESRPRQRGHHGGRCTGGWVT